MQVRKYGFDVFNNSEAFVSTIENLNLLSGTTYTGRALGTPTSHMALALR